MLSCQLGASGQLVPPGRQLYCRSLIPASRTGLRTAASPRKNSLNDLDEIFIKAICHFSPARSRRELVLALSESWETNPTLRLVGGLFRFFKFISIPCPTCPCILSFTVSHRLLSCGGLCQIGCRPSA